MASRTSSAMLQRCCTPSLARPTATTLRLRPTSLPSPLRLPAVRHASYYPHLEPKPKKGIKLGHLFSALALMGIGATAFGLYDFYQSFTAFPSPIRNHLRTALRAINDGPAAYPRAEASFQAAYDLAVELSGKGELGNREEALLKTSGVAIRWGGMWEEAGELGKAAEVYQKGLEEVLKAVHAGGASKKEVMRSVAISMKLGDICVRMGGQEELKVAEERYTWCVQEMMRLKMTPEQLEMVKVEMEGGPKEEGAAAEGKKDELETDLPSWAGDVQLVAGMERLGELYAKLGNVEYAKPLLQQTIALLLPPPPKDGSKRAVPPIPTRCHAATLMNNLSSVLVSAPSPSAKSIEEALRWSAQALTVSSKTRKEAEAARKGTVIPLAQREEAECELVAVVSTYNLGKLSELQDDKKAAKAWFEQSRAQSVRIGSREGVEQSSSALARMQ